MRDEPDEQNGSADQGDALADPRREVDVGDRAARRSELLGESDDGAAGPEPAAPRDSGDGYGAIATFRTPSSRLLKSR